MRGVVVVMIVRIMLLSMLLVVFPGIINDVCNDGGNIVIIGEGGGIICRRAEVMTTINLILFNNMGVRIELIPVKDFFGDCGDGILI